ncbi:hypothetical protein [Streptococcus salivarius]|uniref:hypothetical protein n=1 Tax=Streptococcus salivarius TaxID=1304 RepID=UPI0015832899|nr:hypothetical protein [Streptococcus salivarius]
MREKYLEKIEDPWLQSLVSPLFDFFEPFITEGTEEPLLEKNEERTDSELSDRDDSKKDEVVIKKTTTHQLKKSRKTIEKTISREYLDHRVQEVESSQILNNVNQLLSFAVSNNFRALHSYSASLSTNLTQFVKKERMRNATKWRKVINSYISVTQIMLNIEEIENVRSGIVQNKEVILSLGLVDYTDTELRVSTEIDNLINLSKQSNKFVVVPVFGCTTNVFFKILQEFGQSKIMHVVGHGGMYNGRDYAMQFSDCNMKYNTFIRKLGEYGLNLDMAFLNCCYSYEFVEGSKVDISNETIAHTGKLYDPIAIDFSEHYFTILLDTNNSYTVCSQGGNYDSNKLAYDNAWNISCSNCSENPLQYKRL